MDQPDYTLYIAVTEMPWPPSLAEEFRAEQTFDGFCLRQGNQREKLFLQQCAALNIGPQMSKRELFATDPAALDAHLFYKLEATPTFSRAMTATSPPRVLPRTISSGITPIKRMLSVSLSTLSRSF